MYWLTNASVYLWGTASKTLRLISYIIIIIIKMIVLRIITHWNSEAQSSFLQTLSGIFESIGYPPAHKNSRDLHLFECTFFCHSGVKMRNIELGREGWNKHWFNLIYLLFTSLASSFSHSISWNQGWFFIYLWSKVPNLSVGFFTSSFVTISSTYLDKLPFPNSLKYKGFFTIPSIILELSLL